MKREHPEGLFSPTEVLEPYSDFSNVPDNILFAAVHRGDLVHAYCATVARKVYPRPLPWSYTGFGESFERWFPLVEEVICVEEEIVDFNLGIVGHPDFIGRLRGDRYPRVVDWKTPITKNALWAVQISVYDHLARKFLGTNVEHSGALRLRGDGGQAKFDEVHDPDRWFAAFLEAMDFQKQIEEGF